MSFATRASSQALVLAGLLLAGCAADGGPSLFTTGALGTTPQTAAAPEPKVDPVCVTLATRIEGLRREGVADKVEKAAIKKYNLTKADLAKADQLNKANAEFQQRCSPIPLKPMSADITSPPPAPVAPVKAKSAPKAAATTPVASPQ